MRFFIYSTDFHAQALQHYLLQFDFTSFTVDVALRYELRIDFV